MSILITGGTGFVGRHLVRHLLNTEDEELIILDANPNFEAIADVAGQVQIVVGNVVELTALIDTIKRYRVEGIIHLAYALGTEGMSYLPMIQVNCIGTANVFEAARLTGITRVVYLSSVYVYPLRKSLTGPTLNEDDPAAPQMDYGFCKLFNEHTARLYTETYGLNPIGLRLTASFGLGRGQRRGVEPGHFMVLPELALLGEPVTMPPDDQMADWIYVADAAEVCRLAYRADVKGHHIFNVSAECRRMGEITNYLRSILPKTNISVGKEPIVMASLLSTDRLHSELGFTPKYSVEEGLLEYLDDVKRHQ